MMHTHTHSLSHTQNALAHTNLLLNLLHIWIIIKVFIFIC